MSQFARLTTTGLIKNAPGRLRSIIPNTSTAGVLTLYDNTAASGTIIMASVPLVAGVPILLSPDGLVFVNGLYATIGGAANITFEYD